MLIDSIQIRQHLRTHGEDIHLPAGKQIRQCKRSERRWQWRTSCMPAGIAGLASAGHSSGPAIGAVQTWLRSCAIGVCVMPPGITSYPQQSAIKAITPRRGSCHHNRAGTKQVIRLLASAQPGQLRVKLPLIQTQPNPPCATTWTLASALLYPGYL